VGISLLFLVVHSYDDVSLSKIYCCNRQTEELMFYKIAVGDFLYVGYVSEYHFKVLVLLNVTPGNNACFLLYKNIKKRRPRKRMVSGKKCNAVITNYIVIFCSKLQHNSMKCLHEREVLATKGGAIRKLLFQNKL
jgi:hypothetical protein